MFFLENEFIQVAIAAKGAELQSIFDRRTGQEKLWSGDPAFWGKKSPVLFPIVGALKNDTYYYEGKAYTLPRHGFARDREFEANQHSPTEMIFTLRENAATLKVYPFSFIFKVKYKLVEAALQCTYIVENPAHRPLLFSLGAHPAFAINHPHKSYNQHFLRFNKDSVLEVYKIEGNLISEKTETIPLPAQKLALSHALFYEDALVMKTMQSDEIMLDDHLKFSFKDFPYFGIWAAKDADFVCLEPWCGIADSRQHSQQLAEKEGVIHLLPGANWQRSWRVTCL